MARKIRIALHGIREFLTRKLEVWFVLVLMVIMGAFGWLVFGEIESTQNALCKSVLSSYETQDRLVDELADVTNLSEDSTSVQRMRSFIDAERIDLESDCPVP